jgi:hypothetical protein
MIAGIQDPVDEEALDSPGVDVSLQRFWYRTDSAPTEPPVLLLL